MKQPYEIIIDDSDSDLIQASNNFIIELEKNYEIFLQTLKTSEEKWEKYLTNDDYIFTPESIAIKSPTTIIDGSWGSGKTFFIESLIKNIIDKKTKSKTFQKIILIDVWKYSNSSNVPEEIVEELLCSLVKQNNDKKEKIIKFFKKTFNSTILSWTNKALKTEFDGMEIKESDSLSKLSKEIDLPPTLIFLDNIERIENYSWDILKSVQKLSALKNLCFILPMDKKVINWMPQTLNKREYPIQKYLSIPEFTMKQNYKKILIDKGFDEKFINILNDLIIEKNKNISIRDVSKFIDYENIIELCDGVNFHYSILKLNKVFINNTIIPLRIESDVKELVNYINSLSSQYIEDMLNDIINLKKIIWELDSLSTLTKFDDVIANFENKSIFSKSYNNFIFFNSENPKIFTRKIALLSFFNNELEDIRKEVCRDLITFIFNIKNILKELSDTFWKFDKFHRTNNVMEKVYSLISMANSNLFLEELEYYVTNNKEKINTTLYKFSNLIEITNLKNGNWDISDEKIIKTMINKIINIQLS